MEVHTLAQQASETSPLDALRILERAQLSGRFKDRNKSFASLELVLFRRHQSDIRTLIEDISDIFHSSHLFGGHKHRHRCIVSTHSRKLNRSNHFENSTNQRSHFAGYFLLAANDKVDLWLPKVVRSEVENITRSIDDIRSRFENALVDSEVLESTMSPENMKSIVDEIIFDFSTWAGNSDEIEAEAVSDEVKSSMDAFITQHNEIYDELTKMRQHYEEEHSS